MHRIKNEIITHSQSGRPFLADAYYPDHAQALPLLIFCHGYKGFKDWGAWELAMESLAQSGFYVVKFNFSHNGTTLENPMAFDDLEAFGNNNFSKEMADLDEVITHFSAQAQVDAEKIFLIGHSRGGGIALLKAYEDERIKALVTWAGVSNFTYRFPSDQRMEQWEKEGVFFSENKRTKQQMPHYFQFYEDFKANEERFSIQYAAQHLEKPALILQGTEDEAVKDKEALLLHEWIKHSTLLTISGANHTFGAEHPWNHEKMPDDLKAVVTATAEFLKKFHNFGK